LADLDAYYRITLKTTFEARSLRNPRYSQNAFAKSLGISSTYLSKLFKGNIRLSLEVADSISRRLDHSLAERKKFILSVAEEHRCHALYLLDPTLTDCDEKTPDINLRPARRRKRK
jgi:transcriptional regulator with XRE-family HTH domain